MTTAERLVRKVCEAAMARVRHEESQEDARIAAATPLEAVKPKVRAAVKVLVKLKPTIAEAEATIKAAGFDLPNLAPLGYGKLPAELKPCYSCTHKKQQETAARRQRRITQIDAIQTSTLVKVYGKDPEKVGEELRALEQALAKV